MKFNSKGHKLFRGITPLPMADRLLAITRDSEKRFAIIRNYALHRAMEAAQSITTTDPIEYTDTDY